MRLLKPLYFIPALALLVMSCGPHHGRCGGPDGPPCRGGKHAMMHHGGGGPGACSYKSSWYSEGAVSSNDGVCQSCTGGKWVEASGCESCGGCDHKGCKGKGCDHAGCKMKGKKGEPCHHHDGGRPHQR